MNDRVTILLARELDGTLSDLDRAELERKILLRQEARRDRASWSRVIGALKEEGASNTRLPIERMAAEIVKEASQRAPVVALERVRRVLLAATVAAAGFAVVALVQAPEPRRSQPQPVLAASESAPVELTIDREDREEEVAPITIRF